MEHHPCRDHPRGPALRIAPEPGFEQAGPFMVALIALGLAGQFTPDALFERAAGALARLPAWGLGAAAGIAVATINALGPEGVAPFIYFRF